MKREHIAVTKEFLSESAGMVSKNETIYNFTTELNFVHRNVTNNFNVHRIISMKK